MKNNIDLFEEEIFKLGWKHYCYGRIDVYSLDPSFKNHRLYLEIDYKENTYKLYDYFHHKINADLQLLEVLKIIDVKEK